MKPGEKYIIEIESVSKTPNGDIAFIKGFKTLVFDGYGLSVLKKFDKGANREAVEAAYRDGWYKCAEGVQAMRNTAVAEGMDDAWSMIRTMCSEMSIRTLRKIFNMQDVDAADIIMAIIKAFPAAEVKKRLDAYEKEKEEGKQVPVNAYISLGDEVKFNPDNVTVIVTRLGYNFITGFDKHGDVHTYGLPCNWETTGRHFNLDPLFKFMGRKDDGPEL